MRVAMLWRDVLRSSATSAARRASQENPVCRKLITEQLPSESSISTRFAAYLNALGDRRMELIK
jgi:hypothetical protein